MKVYPKSTHGTKAWLLDRWKDENGFCIFGASDIPALMGASNYTSRGDLYADKLCEPVEKETTAVFQRGNDLEPALLVAASRQLGKTIFTPDVIYRDNRLSISLDGVDDQYQPTVIVEAKTTTRYSVYDETDIPEEWNWQMQAQMSVLNVPCFLVVLDRDMRISVVECKRDEEMIQALLEESENFGAMIDANLPTPELIEEFTCDVVAKVFKPEPTSVELPVEAVDWAKQLDEARAMAKQAADLESKAKDALAQMLLGNEVGTVNGVQLITWKQQAGKTSLDTRTLREEHPELVKQYEKQGAPFRVMRITKGKAK